MSRLDGQVFSLVVSDVKLPRVDGFTILRRLRKECPGTDVVLMTAFGTIADAVAAMKERAIDYVTKPFDLQEMVMVVDRIDERRRLLRELEEARAQLAARRSSRPSGGPIAPGRPAARAGGGHRRQRRRGAADRARAAPARSWWPA